MSKIPSCSACGRDSGMCEGCTKSADGIAETYFDIHPHATIDQRLAMQHAAVYAIQQAVSRFAAEPPAPPAAGEA